MRLTEAIIPAALVAVLATAGAAYALAGGAQPLVMAQQSANPTNDPDVQRGIDERNEQERQRKIQECYDQKTAQMNPKPTGADVGDIRRECEHGSMYIGIRG